MPATSSLMEHTMSTKFTETLNVLKAHVRALSGSERQHNEDNYLAGEVLGPSPEEHQAIEYHPLSDTGILFAVADGMGRDGSGAIASKLALENLAREMAFDRCPLESTFVKRLEHAFMVSDKMIAQYAGFSANLEGMRSTMTAFAILRDSIFVGHVGNARAYVKRGERLQQITRDHTMEGWLQERGKKLDGDQSASSRLLQTLGQDGDLKVAITSFKAMPDDVFMLCSDGLSRFVSHAEINDILERSMDVDVATQQLIDLAESRGSHDDITVILVKYI